MRTDLDPVKQIVQAINALSEDDLRRLSRRLDEIPRIAECVIDSIRGLNKVERQRVGLLLASSDLLPEYKTVKARALKEQNHLGLTGEPLQLFNFLEPVGNQRHRNDCIRHLWPREAKRCKNISLNSTLRARLRKLKSRTNAGIHLIDPWTEIIMAGPKLWLIDWRNAAREGRKITVTTMSQLADPPC